MTTRPMPEGEKPCGICDGGWGDHRGVHRLGCPNGNPPADVPTEKTAAVAGDRGESTRSGMYSLRVGQRAAELLAHNVSRTASYVTDQEHRVEAAREELIGQEQRLAALQLDAAAAQEALDLFYLGREAERQSEAKP